MSVHKYDKLNHLGHILPEGLLVDSAWMEEKGYYRSLRSKYVSSNWLEQPMRGVFRRPWGDVGWEQVVISLQTLLKFPVSLGGRTALELQGYAHYLQKTEQKLHLYADKKLPSWVFKLELNHFSFVGHNRSRFLPEIKIDDKKISLTEPVSNKEILPSCALQIIPWGQWNWPLVISTPERAYLELIDELPHNETFHMADVVMEGLVNLSPRRLQFMLEKTNSIKVKRLFLFFAERHRHQWLDKLDRSKINLGKGKRVLVKNGKLDAKYQITVPDDLNGLS